EAEIGGARFRQHIELLPPHLLESGDRVRRGDLRAHAIFAGNGNGLLHRHHLVRESIWWNVDVTANLRRTGQSRIVPRAFLNDALFGRFPSPQRLPDRRVTLRDNARHFAERESTRGTSCLVGTPVELSWQR